MLNNVKKLDHCFGCGVCAVACPKRVISMHLNDDGFYSPVIDNRGCVECGLCLETCAFVHKDDCWKSKELQCAAAWSNDKIIRYGGTSGGVAYEIGRLALSRGYKVCGVRYDIEEKRAFHYIAENENQLLESIGSKYIQSNTFPAFSKFTKDDKYLVVGLPCQIDSLRRYIRHRKWDGNFILIDLFCHSVPSMLMWNKYLEYVGIHQPKTVRFRDKQNGWQKSYNIRINGDGREWFSSYDKGDLFFRFFLGDRCPNRCCVDDCKYKQNNSAADLRLGDMWSTSYLENKDGVNAIVAFTETGKEMMEALKAVCTFEACDFSTIAELQMQENCHPKISWPYVMKALKGDKSLRKIHNHACVIESYGYILDKIKICLHRPVSIFGLRMKNEN